MNFCAPITRGITGWCGDDDAFCTFWKDDGSLQAKYGSWNRLPLPTYALINQYKAEEGLVLTFKNGEAICDGAQETIELRLPCDPKAPFHRTLSVVDDYGTYHHHLAHSTCINASHHPFMRSSICVPCVQLIVKWWSRIKMPYHVLSLTHVNGHHRMVPDLISHHWNWKLVQHHIMARMITSNICSMYVALSMINPNVAVTPFAPSGRYDASSLLRITHDQPTERINRDPTCLTCDV